MILLFRWIYNIVLSVLFCLIFPFLPMLYLVSKKRRSNLLYRFGLIHLIPPKKMGCKRIWVHALSVGEAKSALPLIQILYAPTHPGRNGDPYPKEGPLHGDRDAFEIVMTVSTITGFQVAREGLNQIESNGHGRAPVTTKGDNSEAWKNRDFHIHGREIALGYFPYDFLFSVRRICNRIDPDAVIIVESDLWPNLLWHVGQKKIPIFLVNARLSCRSLKGYLKIRPLFAHLFSLFTAIMAQTEEDRQRFKKIGVSPDRIEVMGNIKFDQPVPEVDDRLAALLGSRPDAPLLLAGSTHPGEEKILADLYVRLKRAYPTLRMMVAPRDVERASDVVEILHPAFSIHRLLDASDDALGLADLIVVDKMGILAGLYAICDIAFVGGSLLPFGGHNPLEPAAFSKPVIFGPHMTDFLEPATLLTAGEGALQVKTEDEMFQAIQRLLDNPDEAKAMGQHAGEIFLSGKGALAKVHTLIKTHLSSGQLPESKKPGGFS